MYCFGKIREQVQADIMYRIEFMKYLPILGEHCPLFPRQVNLGLTNNCNSECVYCYHRSNLNFSDGFIDEALFDNLCGQMAEHNARLTICRGEPLLHPRVVDFVALAHSRGVFVSIITNASKLDKQTAQGLIEAGLDRISLSFDSMDVKAYERHKPTFVHSEVLHNIEQFCHLNRENGSSVNVLMTTVKTPVNEASIAATEQYFLERNLIDKFFVNELQRVFGLTPFSHLAPPRPKPVHGLFCLHPWTVMSVNHQGRVYRCPADVFEDHFVGDSALHSLENIWNNQAMRNIRSAILARDTSALTAMGPFCLECDAFDPLEDGEKEFRRQLIEFLTNNLWERDNILRINSQKFE